LQHDIRLLGSEAGRWYPWMQARAYVEICVDAGLLGGLSESDFIMAAKINQLPVQLKDR
jgi:pterin-4a-carbinolamine dehydratase